MPAKLVLRSAIYRPLPSHYLPSLLDRQHCIDLLRRRDPLCGRVDNLRTTIGAVAADEIFGVLGPRELGALALANRHDHHVAGYGLATARGLDLERRHGAGAVRDDALRRGVEAEAAAVALRELILVVVARHVGLAAAVDDGRRSGPEA